jgi:hypothetical protein
MARRPGARDRPLQYASSSAASRGALGSAGVSRYGGSARIKDSGGGTQHNTLAAEIVMQPLVQNGPS